MPAHRGSIRPRIVLGIARTLSFSNARLGDVDRNGTIGLAATNDNPSYSVTVASGQGNGTFSNPVSYPLAGGATAVALVRINGDDALDVVELSGCTVVVLLNKG